LSLSSSHYVSPAFLPGVARWRRFRHLKSYQEFDINYFQDEDGMFTAEVPAIRWCVAWGKTLVEAYHNAVDAIESCLEARAKLAAKKLRKPRYAGLNIYRRPSQCRRPAELYRCRHRTGRTSGCLIRC